MFGNYMKIMLRNILRHKSYSIINIMGLAIGIACCLAILAFVVDEFDYETMHVNRDNIYRVVTDMDLGGRQAFIASSGPLLAENFEKDLPGVKNAVRFYRENDVVIKVDEREFSEHDFWFTDSDVFETFTFPLKLGNPATALSKPFDLVISQKVAEKYFGQNDPLGRILSFNGEYDFTITGIMEETHKNSQLKGDFFASFKSAEQMLPGKMNTWSRLGGIYTYLHFPGDIDITQTESRMNELFHGYVDNELSKIFKLKLQHMPEIYLYSDRLGEINPKGNIDNIYLFSALAFMIILIACINFVNLTTARFSHRSKEVGVRKVFGANRTGMIRQFIGESLMLSFLATLVALVLFEIFAPSLEEYFGRVLSLNLLFNPWMSFAIVGLCILVGVGAGVYPAFFLSGFKPVKILKGETPSSSGTILRKLLVVFQFAVSIILIVAIIVIYGQLDFMKNSDLGYNKEDIVTIDLESLELQSGYEAFRNKLIESPDITAVCASPTFPSVRRIIKMYFEAEGIPEDEELVFQTILADHDYIESVGLTLLEGRDFSRDIVSDATNSVIVNESAVKRLGWQQPLGKELVLPDDEDEEGRHMNIIGVVRDFHILSLDEKVEPAVIYIEKPEGEFSAAIRLNSKRQSEAIAALTAAWNDVYQGVPLNYSFISEEVNQMYEKEDKLGEIIILFSALALVIGTLGLYGLVSFSVEKRTKEIGIRKVLGASTGNILMILMRETSLLIIISNVLAWPAAYYFMNGWLENFAYKIDMGFEMFFFAGIVAFVIAVFSISFQALAAAYANPVNALKYE